MQINSHATCRMWTFFGPLVGRNKTFCWTLLTIDHNGENKKEDFRKFCGTFHLMDCKTDCTLLRIPISNGSTIFW